MVKEGFSQDPEDLSRRGKFDPIVMAPVTISQEQHEVNEKEAFSASITDLVVADAETVSLAFKTPSLPVRIHLLGEFLTLTGGTLDFIEAPTWDNQSGALNPVFNRFREAAPQASVVLEDQGQAGFVASENIISNPTTLAGGTIISSFTAFGEKNRFTGSGYAVSKWILSPDTQYACRFTSINAANAAQITLLWYEHTDE